MVKTQICTAAFVKSFVCKGFRFLCLCQGLHFWNLASNFACWYNIEKAWSQTLIRFLFWYNCQITQLYLFVCILFMQPWYSGWIITKHIWNCAFWKIILITDLKDNVSFMALSISENKLLHLGLVVINILHQFAKYVVYMYISYLLWNKIQRYSMIS